MQRSSRHLAGLAAALAAACGSSDREPGTAASGEVGGSVTSSTTAGTTTGSGGASGSGGTTASVGGGGSTAGPTYYGPGIGADSLNNHQVSTIDVDYRFRAAATGTIDSLVWYDIATIKSCPPAGGQTYGCGDGGIIQICIQTDDGTAEHLSTGVDLGCVDVADPLMHGLRTETFPVPPSVIAGMLYHVHWHNTSPDPTNNFISVDAEYAFDATVPRQPTISDTDLAVYRGTTLELHDTPILQVDYSTGDHQGQGYMENWLSTSPRISGGEIVREQFTVTGESKTVKSVSLRLQRDAATAGTSPLTIVLETAGGTLIEQGTIPATDFPLGTTSDVHNAWATYTLTTPRTLDSGQAYHLVLTAPSDTVFLAEPIRRGPSYGFVVPTFFGDGFGQYSTDGGSTWSGFDQPGGATDSTIADVQFYFSM